MTGLARAIARRLLPLQAVRQLAAWRIAWERRGANALAARFGARGTTLADIDPPADARSDGPVLMVNDALAWGGAERQIVNTLTGARAADHPVVLRCLRLGRTVDHDFHLDAVRRLGIDVANAERAGDTPLDPRALGVVAWLPGDIQDEIMRLAAECRRLRPAVLHAWQDGAAVAAGYAALLVGVPRVILAGRNLAPDGFPDHRPHVALAYRELAAHPNVRLINNSEAGARDYARWLGLPAARVTVLRNGVPPPPPVDRQAVAELRARHGIPLGAPVIGGLFRLYAEKRPELWLEVVVALARRRPDLHALLFGAGPLAPDLARRIAAAGLADRVHLPGATAAPTVAIAAFDVMLLTSRVEGTPNVVIEAAALGVPAVVADAGGAAEAVLPGATGLVVTDDDVAGFVRALDRSLDDPDLAARVRIEGPPFVAQRFGMDRMITETLRLWQG